METTISEMETGLKAQLASLTDQIRTSETSLMTLKEGYLKVQGALEVLDILRKELEEAEEESNAALRLALSDTGAD
jgi:hypothetical protein